MGPFYVQIEHVSYSHDTIIISFRDVNIADEWWRTISVDNRSVELERTSPCSYVHIHDSAKNNCAIAGLIYESILASNWYSKCAIVKWPHQVRDPYTGRYQPSPPPAIPPQDVTDHISGKTFYIRSKADPRDFWHVPRRGRDTGTLLVSRTDRTRFRITARDAPTPLNGGPVVMIGSDAIEITEARTGRVVGIDSNNYVALCASSSEWAMTQLVVEERTKTDEQLVVEERGEDSMPVADVPPEGNQENNARIFFKDLKVRFAVVPEDYNVISDGSMPAARRLEVGDGEEWELV